MEPQPPADVLRAINNNQPYRTDHPFHWFSNSLLNVTDEFKEPPVILEVIQDQKKSVVFTLGNISTIIGKAKSRKTFFTSFIAGLFLNGTNQTFRAMLPPDKKQILFIDTEQAKFHGQKVLKRICKIAGMPTNEHPENLTYLSLRPFAPDQRLKIVETAIEQTENLGLMIIDGSRDLLFSFNDERESIEVVTKLMQWSENFNIHICTVLHQNKNDFNARGHLGTELTNKSESILTVEKNDETTSTIKSNLRDRDFQDIAFAIDENDCPYLLENYQPKQPKVYNDPKDQPDHLHQNLLDFVFSKQSEFSFNEFWKAIKHHAGKSDIKLGDNRCRDWANYYLEKSFVENIGTESRMKIKRVN
jgi:hypothetical protein